jgi:futalosine hydrolase
MRILIVAATAVEVAPLAPSLGISAEPGILRGGRYRNQPVDLLITGVGMVATAARVSQALARTQYDVVFNLGVCGSFDPAMPPGTVVHIVTERLAELGAEDGDLFLSARQLQLLDDNEFPFSGGRLVNDAPPANEMLETLPRADGITVNTAHGADASIAAIVKRCAPQVESMEGAAFMYACLVARVRFAQVRAVSNVVERRNRSAWKMPLAIERLGRTALELLEAQ